MPTKFQKFLTSGTPKKMPQDSQNFNFLVLGVCKYLGLENAFKNIANFAILEVFFEKNFGEKNFFFKNLVMRNSKMADFENVISR